MGGDSEKGSPAVAAPRPDLAATLLQLALRCEREEPSRELDDLIARAIGWGSHPDYPGFLLNPEGRNKGPRRPSLFTTSLDAAVTLVPSTMLVENWSEMRDAGHLTGKWLAQLSPRGPRLRMEAPVNLANLRATLDADPCRHAATPALAMCAAALRARAAMATDPGAARTSERSEAPHNLPPPSSKERAP